MKQLDPIYLPVNLTKDVDPKYITSFIRYSNKYFEWNWDEFIYDPPVFDWYYRGLKECLQNLIPLEKLAKYVFDLKVSKLKLEVPKDSLESWSEFYDTLNKSAL